MAVSETEVKGNKCTKALFYQLIRCWSNPFSARHAVSTGLETLNGHGRILEFEASSEKSEKWEDLLAKKHIGCCGWKSEIGYSI